jgi:hypothetical protein
LNTTVSAACISTVKKNINDAKNSTELNKVKETFEKTVHINLTDDDNTTITNAFDAKKFV